MRRIVIAIAVAASCSFAASANATVFFTQQQALQKAFPGATQYQRQTFFLSDLQARNVKQSSNADSVTPMVIRYAAMQNNRLIGHVYFDAHRVRTLPETLMIVVNPSGAIEKIEIISFNEPVDYLPKRRWLDQLHGRKLDKNLALSRSIRPISGASLSGRAVVNASRKILAIHQLLVPQRPSQSSIVSTR